MLRSGWRLTAVIAAVAMLAGPAAQAQFPSFESTLSDDARRYLSGFELDCKNARQSLDKRAFVSSADLDGDGKSDFIFDVAKGCEANRKLYCNPAEGCNIAIQLSSKTLIMSRPYARFRVLSFEHAKVGGKDVLVMQMGKVRECNGADRCQRTLTWTGSAFALTE